MVRPPKEVKDLTKRYIKPDEVYRELEERPEPRFLEEPEEEYLEKEPKEKIIKLRERETLPRAEDEEIKSLQRVSPQIIGNLFDRVRFLSERIAELKAAIEERKRVNKEILSEINEDILTRKEFMRTLAELSDKRDFMLDMSLLAREKRKENVQFWRDLLEISTELRELQEQWEMESKIASIFNSIKS
ncbi:Uncharacterised protein [uncultured archaeon]|nr:Uncharacterised protein [uncultured archaeon]